MTVQAEAQSYDAHPAAKLPAEIEYRAKSAEGKARHPSFKGLREDLVKIDDKDAEEVERDRDTRRATAGG